MTTTLPPYPQRLAAYVDEHGPVLATSTCRTCGVGMEDRANTARTDHGWHVVGEVERIDPWQRLDELLAAGDVAAYSAARAHRVLEGLWPWEHNHLPDDVPPCRVVALDGAPKAAAAREAGIDRMTLLTDLGERPRRARAGLPAV